MTGQGFHVATVLAIVGAAQCLLCMALGAHHGAGCGIEPSLAHEAALAGLIVLSAATLKA